MPQRPAQVEQSSRSVSRPPRGVSKNPRRFDVAVFPVPNAVLFPGVTLPLHIFEDRYRQMLQDIRAKGWPLAVSLAVPENDHEFRLNTICGAGTVQVAEEFPDGRADILVHGRQRVRLLGFVQQKPYFVMEAEEIESDPADPRLESVDAAGSRDLEEFRSLVKAWAFLNPGLSDLAAGAFDDIASVGEICDFFAFHFLKKVEDKQAYLDCLHALERADRLSGFLEKDLLRLSRKAERFNRARLLH